MIRFLMRDFQVFQSEWSDIMEELLVYAIYKKIDRPSARKAMKGVFTAAVREHYLTYNGGYPENPFSQTKPEIHTMMDGLFRSAAEKSGLWDKKECCYVQRRILQ